MFSGLGEVKGSAVYRRYGTLEGPSSRISGSPGRRRGPKGSRWDTRDELRGPGCRGKRGESDSPRSSESLELHSKILARAAPLCDMTR